MNDVIDSIADVKSPVKGDLVDKPILVILPTGHYELDMTTNKPMEAIPFLGEPCYCGQGWGGSPESRYGLEARYR